MQPFTSQSFPGHSLVEVLVAVDGEPSDALVAPDRGCVPSVPAELVLVPVHIGHTGPRASGVSGAAQPVFSTARRPDTATGIRVVGNLTSLPL